MAYTQQTPIGTPDVNLITKTLAGLRPDSALQEYAALHKNNVYILSLAKAESDRRKEMRLAAQGNPGQQPTVVDQSIASMAPAPMMAQQQLPENQGIAQIPTPNMRTLADGGIAGYADDEEGMADGGMFNFAQQSEPVVRMSGGGAIGFALGGGGYTETLRAVLKELKETPQNYLNDEKTRKVVDQLVRERLGATATTATAAKPTAAPAAAPTKAFEAGEKFRLNYGPTIKKVGDTLSDIGTTKLSKLPLNTGAKTAGVLGLGAGLYEGYTQGDFYNDPNVSDIDKAKQAGLTSVKTGLPMVGAGLGSFFTPVGTAVGGAAGTAASMYFDFESDALKAWKKANPQATPEQTKKAAVALAPTYDGPKLNAAQAERATTGQPTITAVPEAKPDPNAGGLKDLLPAVPKFDTEYKPATAPTAADAKAKASELYDSKGQILSLEGKQAQARQDIFNQRDERLAQLNAFSKEQGPAFASYEKMLQKEELQDTTDKEKAGLMSLMKGFLAMAAGESPNAATNIAKGAMAGLGDYGDALKEFKKAAKERTKAMADIENARRAEAKGDFKDQQTFTDRANERLADSADRFTGLISQVTGKEAEVATGIFNNMTNITEETNRMMFKESMANKRFMAEQASANARASMQVNARGPTERLVDRMLTDSKFDAKYREFASIGPEAKGIASIAAKMVGNPAAMMLLKQSDPDLHDQVAAYIKQMALTPQAGAGSRN